MTTDDITVRMTPSHPGTFIRVEAIDERSLSIAAAARHLGVRRATVSELLNGKTALPPEMALRVEDASRMRARASEIDVQRYQPA